WSALAAGEEHQPELADLHLVAVLQQHRPVDPVAVDVGAVEAADVADREALRTAAELRVPTGHGHVIEEDLALGVAAGVDLLGVEQEPAAGARTALDDQQRAAGRQRVDGRGVGLVERAVVALAPRRCAEGDGRGRLAGRVRRGSGRLLKARAALGTEPSIVRVLVSALGAERHGFLPRPTVATLKRQSRLMAD